MTTLQVARETIYQTFVTDWAATTAFTFANENFDPPVAASWVRVSVLHQTGNQETLGGVGNRRFLREGIISIQVFSPLNGGLRNQDALIQTARQIFEGRSLTGPIWCTDCNVFEVGPSDGYHQFNVETNFAYEETR